MVQALNSSSTSPESAFRPVGGAQGWAARDDLIGPSVTRRRVRMALLDLFASARSLLAPPAMPAARTSLHRAVSVVRSVLPSSRGCDDDDSRTR